MAGEFALDFLDQAPEPRFRHLVALGEDGLVGNGGLVQHGHHGAVGVPDAVAGVDQKTGPPQRRPPPEIGLDHLRPALDLAFRRLGVAIAGEVRQHQPAAEGEEVELLGAARRSGDAGQALAPGQRVDEAGFADVGAAGEGDLGQACVRHLLRGGGAGDEFTGLGEQPAAVLDRAGVLFRVVHAWYHPVVTEGGIPPI